MILETDRLILRPLVLADAETSYYGWTGDAEVAKYVSWLLYHSIDDTIKWLKEIEWNWDGAGNIRHSSIVDFAAFAHIILPTVYLLKSPVQQFLRNYILRITVSVTKQTIHNIPAEQFEEPICCINSGQKNDPPNSHNPAAYEKGPEL